MITDLRFVERKQSIERSDISPTMKEIRIQKILQYSDGHSWFDVHLVKDESHE